MMELNGFKPFFVFVFCLLILNSGGNNRVYYIDQLNGNNVNSGTNPDSAWATISKLVEIEIQSGDSILFRGGQVFQGPIQLKNWNGNAEKGILISSYGEGFATISGGKSEAFITDSCSYIEIKINCRLPGNSG